MPLMGRVKIRHFYLNRLQPKSRSHKIMKIEAFMDLTFDSTKLHALPGESDDTLTRLKTRLNACSKIAGLEEIHVVFGPRWAIARAKTDTIEQLTNVINDIGKVFPVKGVLTFIVQPQLYPGETAEDPNFN